MLSFKTEVIKTDVTSVKIIDGFILSGIGGELHVFCKQSHKLLKQYSLLKGQKICGIDLNLQKNVLLIYGGTIIKLFNYTSDFTEVNEIAFYNLYDWILNAKWIDSLNKIGIVSMKNKFTVLSLKLQLEKEVVCQEKCILYSAFICNDKYEEIVVLSGTVFNEILVWGPQKCKVQKLIGHKGVIFSIDYNPINGYICSCSDDRSAILWKVENDLKAPSIADVKIKQATQVYGHEARVFRCSVQNNFFITGGEDSLVILWSFNGLMIRKIEAHQGSVIWSLDCDDENNILAVGGGNSGLSLYSVKLEVNHEVLNLPNGDIPKTVGLLGDSNIFCLSENAALYFHNNREKSWKLIEQHQGLMSYCIMQVSKCRQNLALAGFKGEIIIYKFPHTSNQSIIYNNSNKTRIYSLHWLTCKSFVTCQEFGTLTLYYLENDTIIPISHHILPPSKERWSTTACLINSTQFVVGDRKGNLFLFQIDKADPLQTIKRVHTHLGVTYLEVFDNKLISLGRNAVVKTFAITQNCIELKVSDKSPYSWLARMFSDFVLAFSGNNFVLWSHRSRSSLYEKDCGGGHRSWDFNDNLKTMDFVYVKDKVVHWTSIVSKSVYPVELVHGLHTSVINSLKLIDGFVITGGEDTTLKLLQAENLHKLGSLKAHLSNIRCMDFISWNNRKYLFTAGGRSQIIWWQLTLSDTISTTQICSYQDIRQVKDSEIRVMDLQLYTKNKKLYIFAGCSNGCIKLLHVDETTNSLLLKHKIFYDLKCIMKVCIVFNSILVSMATDGFLVFWSINDAFDNAKVMNPINKFKCHQSGINSYSYKIIDDTRILFLTGGDDNAICLHLISIIKNEISLLNSYVDCGVHCAQITGALLFSKYFITASIDQRVCIFQWCINGDELICSYVTRHNTAVADIQGLEVLRNKIFVYGNGIECVQLLNMFLD